MGSGAAPTRRKVGGEAWGAQGSPLSQDHPKATWKGCLHSDQGAWQAHCGAAAPLSAAAYPCSEPFTSSLQRFQYGKIAVQGVAR